MKRIAIAALIVLLALIVSAALMPREEYLPIQAHTPAVESVDHKTGVRIDDLSPP